VIPPVALIRQQVSDERVEDIPGALRAGLCRLPLEGRVRPGMRVALAVGSRSIACLPQVLSVLVEELRRLQAEPFLVPAMGSHGGGTAEGQRQVLEDYGLGEQALGVPILSSMETVLLGETPEGMHVFVDALAAAADAIIAINRIKEHTAFKGRWESGLMKLLAVGLGDARGAKEIHDRGVAQAMPQAARLILERLPVIAGVAIVENGLHEAARLEVIPAERIADEEPALLDLARRLTPRIPIEPIDLLVVDEMGKDISGTGLDLNVIGMWRRTGGPIAPLIGAVAVLDLTAQSRGNAAGVGHADLVSQRLRDKIDLASTYTNCLTAHNLAGGKIPITLPDDRSVFEAGLSGLDPARARLVLVRNTLRLERLWVSESLLETVGRTPALEQVGPLQELAFDAHGNLLHPGWA